MSHALSHPIIESSALLLGRVAYGEADLIVHLFTQKSGRISAHARGARRSQKRFSGSLEPMHTLHVEVSESRTGQLYRLRGSSIEQARMGLTSKLDALTAAGKALKWVRLSAPAGTPEPLLWESLCQFMDGLESAPSSENSDQRLASFGLRLLELLGWGLNLHSCVSCGKPCPPERSAWVSPERGGLICRSCGGGPFQISGPTRSSLALAALGELPQIPESSVAEALRIVERALRSHLGLENPAH